jgi:hypothetical protein
MHFSLIPTAYNTEFKIKAIWENQKQGKVHGYRIPMNDIVKQLPEMI